MATIKRRLNITLNPEMEKAIKILAKKDSVPEATKASDLLKFALEINEDSYLYELVETRDKKGIKYIKYQDFWK